LVRREKKNQNSVKRKGTHGKKKRTKRDLEPDDHERNGRNAPARKVVCETKKKMGKATVYRRLLVAKRGGKDLTPVLEGQNATRP